LPPPGFPADGLAGEIALTRPEEAADPGDAPPFGRYAPSRLSAFVLKATRLCPPGWAGKRLAFFLRSVAVRFFRGEPVDTEALGALMRLSPYNNVAEKRLLFTPQYFDPAERRLLATRLHDDFVFLDIGASVGGYALFVAAHAGPSARILAVEPLPEIFDRLERSSDYQRRREEVRRWNAAQPLVKRGLALTPVKFGIAFTSTLFNQAGALLQVYADGTVLLNHGGTEMGQGLHVKVAQVVAEELGLPLSAIRISATDTSKVPNTSATAASSGSDLNGKAAQAAAIIIRDRLAAVASQKYGVAPEEVAFADGHVQVGAQRLSFAALARNAHEARVSLSAAGYYRTPKIHWDRDAKRGRPFYYFAFGAAVAEVAVDTLTGETQLLRIDILHDVGTSLNPAIDLGQIEGGFLQGVGWLTSEELYWNGDGQLGTHAPSTYKIPTARDWPADARVELLPAAPNSEDTIFRSKAVGEPPLMLAISVFHAIRDACAACGPAGCMPDLPAPATPEAVLRAIDALRRRHAA